jgi:integrase
VERRAYGSGRLFVATDKAGRESWYGSWWAGGVRVKRRLGPKRRPATSDGLTRTQAERELRKRIESDTVLARNQRRTVAEAGEAYIEYLQFVMERKPTTIGDYRGYLRLHLAPFFAHHTLDKIDAPAVEAFLRAKRHAGLSSKTVHNFLNFLHGLFRFAIRRGWAERNPVAMIDRPPAPRSSQRRIQFLQPEELDALVRAVPDDELGAVEGVIYLTAAMTGLRQGELVALRWIDVDYPARRVRVADSYTRGAFGSPKSGHGRSVPMGDRLAGELERHHQRSRWQAEQDLVFAHPLTSHVLDASKLRKRFNLAIERAEVRRITFHELRHTFGTQMAAVGAPLRAIQEWMGHADASTTEVYAHYAPDPTNGAIFVQRAFGSADGQQRSSASQLSMSLR